MTIKQFLESFFFFDIGERISSSKRATPVYYYSYYYSFKITISSIVTGVKKLPFSTNSLAKLLSESSSSESSLSESSSSESSSSESSLSESSLSESSKCQSHSKLSFELTNNNHKKIYAFLANCPFDRA